MAWLSVLVIVRNRVIVAKIMAAYTLAYFITTSVLSLMTNVPLLVLFISFPSLGLYEMMFFENNLLGVIILFYPAFHKPGAIFMNKAGYPRANGIAVG